MQYLNEKTLEIRILETDGLYGCDVFDTEGKPLAGVMPEYKSQVEAVAAALDIPEVGLFTDTKQRPKQKLVAVTDALALKYGLNFKNHGGFYRKHDNSHACLNKNGRKGFVLFFTANDKFLTLQGSTGIEPEILYQFDIYVDNDFIVEKVSMLIGS